MRIIGAYLSSSMFRNRRIAQGLLIIFIVASGTTFACGPSYQYWHHIGSTAAFDPLIQRTGDSTYLFRQFFPQGDFGHRGRSGQKERQNDAYDAIALLLSEHRPEIVFMPPNRYQEFIIEHCFNVKYRKVYGDSSDLMSLAASIMKSLDEKESQSAEARSGAYYPAYDEIADPSALDFLTDLHADGPDDKYSSYLSSVKYQLARCYVDKGRQLNWPSVEKLLIHLQAIPEYEVVSSLALLMGYAANGSPDQLGQMLGIFEARFDKHLPRLDSWEKPLSPRPWTLDELAARIVVGYETVLQDEAVMTRRPVFELQFSSSGYSWGSCASNTLQNMIAFNAAAIKDATLSDFIVQELLTYRARLSEICPDTNEITAFLDQIRADQKTPYHAYLLAITYFYSRDYLEAQRMFTEIADQDIPWVTETALYLAARSQLIASQANWTRHLKGETIDKSLALGAAEAFRQYVSEYPEGLYVDSANGLVRRAHWLVGDQSTYRDMLIQAEQEFLRDIGDSSDWTEVEKEKLADFFHEYRLKGEFHDDGDHLALIKAFAEGVPVSKSDKYTPFSRLVGMSTAYDAFQREDYSFAINQYRGKSGLNEAELLLLARSYEMNGQLDEALDVWRSDLTANGPHQSVIDYETSKILFQNYGVERVVMDEALTNTYIKRVYLASLCDDSLQNKLLKDDLPGDIKHIVIADLALRYLYFEDFQKLHQLMQDQPDSFIEEFSAIRTAVKQIANNESLGKAHMNIAYFLQTAIQNPIYALDSDLAAPSAPQCRQNTMAAGAKGPYYYFNKSLEFFDENEQSTSEEKALYYLTVCTKPSRSSCSWGIRPTNGLTSKEAFTKLHDKYQNGKWASQAKYYY